MTGRHVIERSGDILGGTPVFAGTRVLVRTLIDYLEAGSLLDDFLDDCPMVDCQQATAVLELVKAALLTRSDLTDAREAPRREGPTPAASPPSRTGRHAT